MSYLVPTGRRSQRERNAIRHVGERMQQADEEREAEALEREDHVAEDQRWDAASGTESPSTQRIVQTWREQRGGEAYEDDAYLDDVRADGEARAGLPGDAPQDTDAAARVAKAVKSVAKIMRPGVVKYADEESGEDVPVTADDYVSYDEEILSDFQHDDEPARPPPVAPVEDSESDGYFGPHVIRRASEPPPFSPNG